MAYPTDKQIKFAMAIAEKLGIPLPKEETSKAYWEFLNEHRDAYYDKVNAENGVKPRQTGRGRRKA